MGSAAQRKCHVAGTATEIQDTGIRALQDRVKFASGAPPPEAVDVEGENVVEKIVARRDRGKHLADGGGSGLTVVCSRGRGTYDGLLDLLIHTLVGR
jgi:hypothetical protein